MFELPDAKRVRRAELFSSPPSPSRSFSPETQGQPSGRRLDLELGFVDVTEDKATALPTSPPHTSDAAAAPSLDRVIHDSYGAFEFRLFSSGNATTATTQPPRKVGTHHNIIRIRSPTPPLCAAGGNGAFIVPSRPQSYYFTPAAADLERQDAYQDAAVSGAEVLEMARKTRWPGTALPWRVIHLPLHSSTSAPSQRPSTAPAGPTSPLPPNPTSSASKSKTRRVRAGKKRRLALRTKFATAAAEREKRTRRNREKKVKKKAREKRAKEGGGAAPQAT